MIRRMIAMVLLGGLVMSGCALPSARAGNDGGCSGCNSLKHAKGTWPGGALRR